MISLRGGLLIAAIGVLLSLSVLSATYAAAPQDPHEGMRPIKWTLYPQEPPPTPSAMSIVVAVHERVCAGGRDPISHLGKPEVRSGRRAVVITLWIDPPEGLNTCPSNPIGRLKVRLPNALGKRKLYDGATDPPRKVKPGEDPRRL